MMSFEAGKPGDYYTSEAWKMICLRYYTAGLYINNKRTLEIGCGTGRGLGYLSAKAKDVVGGDLSADNLAYAKAYYGNRIKLLLFDACNLPFSDGSFDVILCMEVVQYLPDLKDFLYETHRVLSNNGILIFCIPNPDIPGFQRSPQSRRHYSVPELASWCARYNFSAAIFGAFPITGNSLFVSIRSSAVELASRFLKILPGGDKLHLFIQKTFLGKNIVGSAEIKISDINSAASTMYPLTPASPDSQYQTLYVIASPLPEVSHNENS